VGFPNHLPDSTQSTKGSPSHRAHGIVQGKCRDRAKKNALQKLDGSGGNTQNRQESAKRTKERTADIGTGKRECLS